MNLELYRRPSSRVATIGELHLNGVFECFTLEDVVREFKQPGKTAIPPGRYRVDITWSPRFQRPLPLLDAVPNFEGVRIHPGNTAEDTDGCILVGTQAGENIVTNSRVAFDRLYTKLELADEVHEPILIEIFAGELA